ncbi:thiamine pyrophosphate-binding protein [Raineyella fluvialis]|uniref:Thiamine pyrophosphate-binding protein n=1 Tax=Raineyella fluvialis TaxID=2662261 RepID=A0A5Q2F5Y1_9ACTN|nr:thiamine pyrophosphate-binding protein [Raineyella fluvialis]QGF22362.1 thiamine pyrophosphate-binding protein [Raineyella fluvialis]
MVLASDEIVRYLEGRGVTKVFGLCGHTNIAVLDALSRTTAIDFVNVRHEQIAAHAADGYARVTRKASVVLSHLGPGLTNAATGVANAALDSIPMVVIAGDVPTYYFGKHPHQEVNYHADGDQWEIYRPFVKRAFRVERAEMLPEILDRAFVIAESGRPGPVLVDVPMDLFSLEIDSALVDRALANRLDYARPTITEELAEQIVRNLVAAERPLVYAGGGILLADASAELTALVDWLDLPVAHSLMGKGAVPDDNPHVLGMSGFWGVKFTNNFCLEADWILGLGTRFAEADSSSWYEDFTFRMPPTRLMQIDIDPEQIGRNYPVEIGAVADLKQALGVLLKVAKRIVPDGVQRPGIVESITEERATRKEGFRADQVSDEFPMNPARILADLRQAIPAETYVVTDVGWNKNGVGQQYDIVVPGTFVTPGGFATMGFGSSAAIGVKLAAPDRPVVALIGDGGFGQNPAVLATARRERIPIVWVVMNNNAFGTIAGLEKANYGTTYGTTFEVVDGDDMWIDYAAVARGYGIKAVRVEGAEHFAEVLAEALSAEEPFLIDVPMRNIPTPTAGHWNILDIYSPEGVKGHAVTD